MIYGTLFISSKIIEFIYSIQSNISLLNSPFIVELSSIRDYIVPSPSNTPLLFCTLNVLSFVYFLMIDYTVDLTSTLPLYVPHCLWLFQLLSITSSSIYSTYTPSCQSKHQTTVDRATLSPPENVSVIFASLLYSWLLWLNSLHVLLFLSRYRSCYSSGFLTLGSHTIRPLIIDGRPLQQLWRWHLPCGGFSSFLS